MKRTHAALFAIIAVAVVLRVYWNDVDKFSPADETVYTSYTRQLLHDGFVRGYPEIVRWFNDERMWRSPSALRFGYLALTTAAAEMYGAAEPRALAWLSTIAGILVVPLLYGLGSRLFNRNAGVVAAAFGAVSSIELALGRRALQDEVFCLAVLVALICVLVALERDRTADIAVAVIAIAAALSIKESMLLLYPAFGVVALVYRAWRPRHLLMFALPPVIDYLIFSALARDFGAFARISRTVWGATAAPYVVQYQAGPPHRLLLDFFITSPFVSLLAAGAIAVALLGRGTGKRERALALFVIFAVVALAVIPSKSLRFVMVIDPIVCMLAAWIAAMPGVTRRALSGVMLAAIVLSNAVIELELFRAIFIRGGVYDPVTQTMLEALGAVPRDNPAADTPLYFPWICGALFLAAWIYERLRGHALADQPREVGHKVRIVKTA